MNAQRRRQAKIAVDAAMAVVMVALMATAIVQEAPHEWFGIALFVLVTTHIVHNRRWIVAVLRRRRNALQTAQLVTMALLVGCIVGLAASSLVLSKHVFGFLPALPGAAWARRIHMICSYWAFVLAFVHAGLHMRLPRRMSARSLWACRLAWDLVACYGVWSFMNLGLPAYLLGQVQFAAVDFQTPLVLSFVRWTAIATLVAGVTYLLRERLSRRKRKDDSGSGHPPRAMR